MLHAIQKILLLLFYRLLLWGGGLNDTDGTWDLFVDAFASGTGHNGSWSKHVLEFWKRRDDKSVLFLKYKEMVKDLPKAVRTIAMFLNRKITDEDVARICEHCHVDNMRKNDKVNMSYCRDFKKVFDNTDGGFINQGKAGAWKQLLTPDKVEKISGLLKEIDLHLTKNENGQTYIQIYSTCFVYNKCNLSIPCFPKKHVQFGSKLLPKWI